ncbi:energy transducer TonB [Laribacter hongkongensis]|uniref:Energy transducer TonB n=1 Tax=Laribacter hongkongensis TaxID=168471 RepID=A0ABD4SQE4_9NEIS|nr:energy transducer TonB [Laribacter hongkongensis]MCG9025843.1 energy transducer TonB [Laribacter hongkongensis]MCG9100651.1 energy transducer TonB [Laribacter hongkongensis]MCG9104459.1 energy transducer TonB [Laribacter hongkongensis]MCG9112357.1 energy transducer TonB [Laribacter hongkongensis]MCG9117427.1 energy transducer TonB [Laribacter hongkongensis]
MDIKSSPVATAGTLLLHGVLLLALWQTATSRITAAPAMPQATQVELVSLDTPPAPAATAPAPAPATPQTPAASRAQAATTPSRPENRPRSHAASDTAASPAPAESSSSHTSAPATSSATTAPGSQRGTTDGSAHEAPPSFTADYLANPAPAYPPLSQELGESGQVRLRVAVDASGAPSQVEIAESSGFTRLDRAALSAVKRWRFVPARRGSEAVAGRVIVPIHFNLKTLEG